MTQTRMGKPCLKGHSGLRYASNYNCVECQRERYEDPKLRDRQLQYVRKYRARKANPVERVTVPGWGFRTEGS